MVLFFPMAGSSKTGCYFRYLLGICQINSRGSFCFFGASGVTARTGGAKPRSDCNSLGVGGNLTVDEEAVNLSRHESAIEKFAAGFFEDGGCERDCGIDLPVACGRVPGG